MGGMHFSQKLTRSGLQRCRTEGQQGAAADRRGSEEGSVGDEGDRCSHDDLFASHFCFCESSDRTKLTVMRLSVADTTRCTDNLWVQLLLVPV